MGDINVVAQVGENVGQISAGVYLVIYDQNGRSVGSHDPLTSYGKNAVSRTVNVLPLPTSLASRMLPLFLSRMDRAMASPRPKPRALVEYKGSMIRWMSSEEMPTPVSAKATSRASFTICPLIEREPPCGMASRALRIKLAKTIRS